MASVRTKSKSRKSVRPFDVAMWLTTTVAYTTLKDFARRVRKLAKSETDDITSELALILLERKDAVPPTEEQFLVWVEELSVEVAKRLRNADMRSPGVATDTEVLAATVTAQDDCEPELPFTHCSELVAFEKARRERIKRALGKLTDGHREAITARFFSGAVLSDVAAEQGMCDSSHRMRLLRAKKKLATLIDADGYALSA
jgi:RNA polymerase sigma factor (sigma-70 family)